MGVSPKLIEFLRNFSGESRKVKQTNSISSEFSTDTPPRKPPAKNSEPSNAFFFFILHVSARFKNKILKANLFFRRFQTAGSYEVFWAWNGSLHKTSPARNISPRFTVSWGINCLSPTVSFGRGRGQIIINDLWKTFAIPAFNFVFFFLSLLSPLSAFMFTQQRN